MHQISLQPSRFDKFSPGEIPAPLLTGVGRGIESCEGEGLKGSYLQKKRRESKLVSK